MQEQLQVRCDRWKKAMNDAATGPLVIAKEIVQLGDNWGAYKKEAGGLAYTAFLRRHVGKGLKFFQSRAKAVDILDESARRYIDHEVAIWVVGCVTETHMAEVKAMLHREYKARNGHPLTKTQAVPLVRKITGVHPRVHTCANCRTLEARIRELEGVSTAAE